MKNENQVVNFNNANATVVLNDTLQQATVASADTKQVVAETINPHICAESYLRIEQLAADREAWEQGAFRTSNEQLYALLAKCYAMYDEMCGKTDEAKAIQSALKSFIKAKGYTFLDSTHTLTKIVKCVFGVDRRRVSTYSLVLREALSQKLPADQIAGFITAGGGVEEIRRSKSPNAETPKQKAEQGKQVVSSKQLAVVSSDKIAESLDLANVGNDLVAIVTQQADGSLIVRALVNSKSVLNAALACAYSKNKPVVESDKKNAEAANDDAALDNAIKQAVNS